MAGCRGAAQASRLPVLSRGQQKRTSQAPPHMLRLSLASPRWHQTVRTEVQTKAPRLSVCWRVGCNTLKRTATHLHAAKLTVSVQNSLRSEDLPSFRCYKRKPPRIRRWGTVVPSVSVHASSTGFTTADCAEFDDLRAIWCHSQTMRICIKCV